MIHYSPPAAASPSPSLSSATPQLSIIIPIYASGPEAVELLRSALRHLEMSDFLDFEVVVADDGSPEANGIERIVGEAGAQLVRLDRRSGPAAARNAAARKAAGNILMFLDADTTVHPDALSRIAGKFSGNPTLDAVMGSYDQQPTAPGVVSRFRNLLHSFVHHRGSGRVCTFWAGCGAVRRDRFEAVKGFDECLCRPSIEDVEFGLRLSEGGGSIELDPQIQVTHHKVWTLSSMIRTDLFWRALPWAGILLKHSGSLDLNFKAGDRISAALAVFTLLTTLIALIHGGMWWVAPLAGLATIGLLNWRLFRFLASATSRTEALFCFPLLLIYVATCIAGLIGGMALAEHRRDRWFWPVTALTGVILLGLQISGGAFQAEFTASPDEAAHFVSGLMVYDYLASLPRDNPTAWARQYYLHYPKVAIGHWPPLYHAMEGVWWLFTSPSRTTAMLLQWLIGLFALTVLYRLSREFLPLSVAVAIVAFTIATPVFQESLQETMADLCCLLWSVLAMHAVVRLAQKQDRTASLLVILWLLAAALTKGTAVCLAPAPALALLASGQKIRIPLASMGACAIALVAAVGWYVGMGKIQAWGGISLQNPYRGDMIGHLAGWGFVALAAFGLRRHPLALVAGSFVVSTLGIAFAVRAMREDRHWIIALPALLVLAGFAVTRFRQRWVGLLLVAPAVVLFPYVRYAQSKSGYADLLAQIRLPSRMVISSAGMGEGPWIAVASLAEQRRPSSFIARASKILVEEGWDGEGYRLITTTRDAVLRRLDELALNIVILHTPPNVEPPAHHVLLRDAVSSSRSWSLCGNAGDLLAYCRITAPKVPRQPLRLQVHGWDFEERISR